MIRASAISVLMFPARVKAFLVNQRFQESDALRPNWRYPQTAKDRFRRVCYESIDLIVSAIDQGFNPESNSFYAQMKTFLIKAANGDDYEEQFKFLETSHREDVDTGVLPMHATQYFGSYVKGEDIMF